MRDLRTNNQGIIGMLIILILILIVFFVFMSSILSMLIIFVSLAVIVMIMFAALRYVPMPAKMYIMGACGIGLIVLVALWYFGVI